MDDDAVGKAGVHHPDRGRRRPRTRRRGGTWAHAEAGRTRSESRSTRNHIRLSTPHSTVVARVAFGGWRGVGHGAACAAKDPVLTYLPVLAWPVHAGRTRLCAVFSPLFVRSCVCFVWCGGCPRGNGRLAPARARLSALLCAPLFFGSALQRRLLAHAPLRQRTHGRLKSADVGVCNHLSRTSPLFLLAPLPLVPLRTPCRRHRPPRTATLRP
jgi:hypothetical protein